MNDWQEFGTSLVSSLAWPVAVVVLALTFRKTLSRLLSNTGIKSLKAGPGGVQVEYWQSKLAEAREDIDEGAGTSSTETRVPRATSTPLIDEMSELIALSPRSAVTESYRRLEKAVRVVLDEAKVTVPGHGMSVRNLTGVKLIRTAEQHNVVNRSTLDGMDSLRQLRNQAAHSDDDNAISHAQALDFVTLADDLLEALA